MFHRFSSLIYHCINRYFEEITQFSYLHEQKSNKYRSCKEICYLPFSLDFCTASGFTFFIIQFFSVAMPSIGTSKCFSILGYQSLKTTVVWRGKTVKVNCHWLFSTKTAARLAKSVERLTNERKVGLIFGVVPTLRF